MLCRGTCMQIIDFVFSCYNDPWCSFSLLWTSAPDSPFSVSPPSCNLSPLKCTSFIVTYEPKQPNTVHAAQLECFAYYQVLHFKVNRLFYEGNCVEGKNKLRCLVFHLDAAGDAEAVSSLLRDRQSHRPLASARRRANYSKLLFKALAGGETLLPSLSVLVHYQRVTQSPVVPFWMYLFSLAFVVQLRFVHFEIEHFK